MRDILSFYRMDGGCPGCFLVQIFIGGALACPCSAQLAVSTAGFYGTVF
jgi:hypothetical protein